MVAAVFVYGTLMPGRLRWPLLADAATAVLPAEVAGQLYDTGQGWPAARFDEPLDEAVLARGHGGRHVARLIPGWAVELAARSSAALLERLDEVEDVGSGRYRRVRVLTTDGLEAWAYEAMAVEPGWVPLDAWVGDNER